MPKTKNEVDEEMTTEIILGEFIQMMLDMQKDINPTFSAMPQEKQQDIIDKFIPKAKNKIKSMVRVVASQDFASTYGRVKSINITDKHIEAKLLFGTNDEQLHRLVDFSNKHIVVTLISPDEYFLDADVPEPDSDQGDLELDDDES